MLAPGTSIAELQALPRWVGWRFEPRKAGGRPTKVPFAPNSGRPAKANNSATWGEFSAAEQMAGCDGAGFMLQGLAELAALDCDHCRDPATGRIAPWAEELCERAQSYVEITPSGEGLRILGIATGLPATIRSYRAARTVRRSSCSARLREIHHRQLPEAQFISARAQRP